MFFMAALAVFTSVPEPEFSGEEKGRDSMVGKCRESAVAIAIFRVFER